jgi:hypothetical protein
MLFRQIEYIQLNADFLSRASTEELQAVSAEEKGSSNGGTGGHNTLNGGDGNDTRMISVTT